MPILQIINRKMHQAAAVLEKEPKVHSMAINEMRDEIRKIVKEKEENLMKNRHQTIRQMGRIALNIFYYSSIVLFSFILIRVALALLKYQLTPCSQQSFPGIMFCNKLAYGARIFDYLML